MGSLFFGIKYCFLEAHTEQLGDQGRLPVRRTRTPAGPRMTSRNSKYNSPGLSPECPWVRLITCACTQGKTHHPQVLSNGGRERKGRLSPESGAEWNGRQAHYWNTINPGAMNPKDLSRGDPVLPMRPHPTQGPGSVLCDAQLSPPTPYSPVERGLATSRQSQGQPRSPHITMTSERRVSCSQSPSQQRGWF